MIEDQLLEGLAERLEAALDIVATPDATFRLEEIIALCLDAVALARAGRLMLDR
jgi:hypothetical protein